MIFHSHTSTPLSMTIEINEKTQQPLPVLDTGSSFKLSKQI